jgi:hypothetical protein
MNTSVRDAKVTWRICVGRELTFGRNSCSDASIDVTEGLWSSTCLTLIWEYRSSKTESPSS